MEANWKLVRIQITFRGYKPHPHTFELYFWHRMMQRVDYNLRNNGIKFKAPLSKICLVPYEPLTPLHKKLEFDKFLNSEPPMTTGQSLLNSVRKIFRLPVRQTKTTVLVSPHVDKEAREQFENGRYHFVIDIQDVRTDMDMQTVMNEARKALGTGEIVVRFIYVSKDIF
jgi:hypothetical protein